MKWKIPEKWSTRIIDKFLLFPKNLNGTTRWFEWVKIQQVCVHDHIEGVWWWHDESWVDLDIDK